MEDLEREDCEGQTQEVGGPCGVLRKWATMFVVACFFPSLSPSLMLTTLNLTDVSMMTRLQVDDANDSGSTQITTANDSNDDKRQGQMTMINDDDDANDGNDEDKHPPPPQVSYASAWAVNTQAREFHLCRESIEARLRGRGLEHPNTT